MRAALHDDASGASVTNGDPRGVSLPARDRKLRQPRAGMAAGDRNARVSTECLFTSCLQSEGAHCSLASKLILDTIAMRTVKRLALCALALAPLISCGARASPEGGSGAALPVP